MIIETTSMITVRMLLTALMGIFVLVCFAQPAAPEVSIEIVTIAGDAHVRLKWEPVEEAEFYNIYISNDSYFEGWIEPIETVGTEVTEYISSLDYGNAKFYMVTSYVEVPPPDRLVLVEGDLFYGEVTIDPFYIGRYEVTQEEWFAVMGTNPSYFSDNEGVPNNENLPVESVSWFDAVEYCNRLSIQDELQPAYSYYDRSHPDDWYEVWPGWNEDMANHTNISCNWDANGYRLPTESEWHHAANAGIHPQPFTYAGSSIIGNVAWYNGNSDNMTHPVGELAPNDLGIYDMSGNVFEWCWDIRSVTWPPVVDNPRGDLTGVVRIQRGGSWIHVYNFCYLTMRTGTFPVNCFNTLGFRLARSIS